MTQKASPSSDSGSPGRPATVAQRATEISEALGARGFVPKKRFASMLWERPAPGGCTIALSRQSRTRYAGEVRYRQHLGFRVRIDLDCEVYTGLYFVKSGLARSRILRRIWRWRRLHLVEELPAGLDGHVMLAREPDWADRLLLDGDTTGALGDLLDRHAGKLAGSVYLEPGTLAYASPILTASMVEASFVEQTLDELETVRDACARIPPPRRALPPSKLRAFTRDRPLAAALLTIGALLGCLGVLGMIGFGLLVGLGALMQAS